MRKIALLTGVAGALLIAGPVLAQEATPSTPAPAQQAAPSQISLTPGQTVSGPDGELGKLEGVQVNDEGQQELTVRGADGQLRAVPLTGIQTNGDRVSVGFTSAEYQAAPAIPGSTPTPPVGEGDSEDDAAPAAADTLSQPMTPAAPSNTAPTAPSPASAPGTLPMPSETPAPAPSAVPEAAPAPTTEAAPEPAEPATTSEPMEPETAAPAATETQTPQD